MATRKTHLPGPGGGGRFAPELTLGEARARLFAVSGFPPDGGYADAWVKLKLWRIPLAFPNTAGRRRAVRFHDLHHVLTEYPTTWRGEFEIAAWEVAGGVNRYWEGWLLDLLGFAAGLFVYPRHIYRAFMRVVDLVFFFAPSVHQGGEGEWHATDLLRSFLPMFAMALGLGGIWLWYYFGQLASRPLLPLGERDLEQAIAAAEHH